MVDRLNGVFSAFDAIARNHGVQKIKTIGDGYMAVAGVPDARDDHLQAICRMALDMQQTVRQLRDGSGERLRLRIGISTGPVVARVIGTTRFSFDLWGDTVNLASRLESNGQPGRIQMSALVRQNAANDFDFVPADVIDIKGFGLTEAFFLEGEQRNTRDREIPIAQPGD